MFSYPSGINKLIEEKNKHKQLIEETKYWEFNSTREESKLLPSRKIKNKVKPYNVNQGNNSEEKAKRSLYRCIYPKEYIHLYLHITYFNYLKLNLFIDEDEDDYQSSTLNMINAINCNESYSLDCRIGESVISEQPMMEHLWQEIDEFIAEVDLPKSIETDINSFSEENFAYK